MSEQPVTLPNGHVLDEKAVKRQQLWEGVGMPMSPMYMSEADLIGTYRNRMIATSEKVLDEMQRALRFVACPACTEVRDRDFGIIAVTRLHIHVQDDVMTVFKAMARCFCFNCGFEEYWPLQRDPRAQPGDAERNIQELLRRNYGKSYAYGAGGGGAGGLAGGLGNALGGAGLSGMMMTTDERAALMRAYNQYQKEWVK